MKLRLLLGLAFVTHALAVEPPVMLLQEEGVHDPATPGGSRTAFSILRLPDGKFAFFDRYKPAAGVLTLRDRQGKAHELKPALPDWIAKSESVLKSGVLQDTQVILTPTNEVLSVYVQAEKLEPAAAKEVGLRIYLDVWCRKSAAEAATPPIRIWRGYNGSQIEYEQMPDGRLIAPFGSMIPFAKGEPPTGRHETVIQYSDDQGVTWKESVSKIVSPCYEGFNGSNEGACEPCFERLQDGRIWMLTRSQAGFLYSSVSKDNGTTWEKATASRFNTSTGPANLMRHSNGWLVLTWNNCEMPSREAGDGVYGGRDALHMAVSDNDGKTWRGFREIYLDHRRNDNPAANGDRGTAYPLGAYTEDGKIVIISGQGAGGRQPILIDPEWIVATEARSDFADGLEQWSIYKGYGPAKRWWRARALGATLADHPAKPGAKCLHVRNADDHGPDGAVWNFPNAWKGTLNTRVMMREGGQGGTISLNDRFFDPVIRWAKSSPSFSTAWPDYPRTPGMISRCNGISAPRAAS